MRDVRSLARTATPVFSLLLLVSTWTASSASARLTPRSWQAADAVADAVVLVEYVLEKEGRGFGAVGQRSEMGTVGTIVTEDGLVLVSDNIFPEDEEESRTPARPHTFWTRLRDGTRVPARLIGRDRDAAIALLRLQPEPTRTFPHASLSRTSKPSLGDAVLLVGLLPEKYDYQPTLVPAHVTAVLDEPRGLFDVDAYIQDSMVGAPAIDSRGRVIGLIGSDPFGNSATGTLSAPLKLIGAVARLKEPGFPVLVSAASLAPLVERPPLSDPVSGRQRAWLGVTLQPVNRALARYLGLDGPSGVLVTSVWGGSPAEAAGFRAEDVIVTFGGQGVEAPSDELLPGFIELVQRSPIGQSINVEVVRGGERMPLAATLRAAPTTSVRAAEHRSLDFGLVTRNLTVDIIMTRGWPQDQSGVLVSEVETAGWAQVGGLQVGDVILSAQDQLIRDVDDLASVLERARNDRIDEVVFFVLREPDTLFVHVQTNW